MQTMNRYAKKYIKRVRNQRAPGEGCHHSLLGAANYGIMAGIPPGEIFSDIRASIPAGTRKVHDKEIEEAIQKAARDTLFKSFATLNQIPNPGRNEFHVSAANHFLGGGL
jgi:hypothetical protein